MVTDIVRLHERVMKSRPVAGVGWVHPTKVEVSVVVVTVVTVVTTAVAMHRRSVDSAAVGEDMRKRTFSTELAVALCCDCVS